MPLRLVVALLWLVTAVALWHPVASLPPWVCVAFCGCALTIIGVRRAQPGLIWSGLTLAALGAGVVSGSRVARDAAAASLVSTVEQWQAASSADTLDDALDDGTGRVSDARRDGVTERVPLVPVLLVGRLRTDAVETARGGALLQLDVSSMSPVSAAGASRRRTVTGGVQVAVGGHVPAETRAAWVGGREVALPAVLRRPTMYLDPGVPDLRRLQQWRGIAMTGSVKSAALVDVRARGSRLDEVTARIRAWARQRVAHAVGHWREASAATVAAIVIGDRSQLDPDLVRDLQDAGTFHVMAISGGNVAVCAAVVATLARWLGRRGRASAMVAALFVTAYGLTVTGGASVARATVMAALTWGAAAADLRVRAAQSVSVAVGALLLVDPLLAVDTGFLLTTGATVGLIATAPWLTGRRWPLAVQAVGALLLASLAADVALLPVAASVFGRVTVAGLALNLVAVPVMAVTQVVGMAATVGDAVSPALGRTLGWVAAWCADALVRSGHVVRWVPWSHWRVAAPSWTICGVYYVALVVAVGRLAGGASVATRWHTPISLAAWCIWACAAVAIAADLPARWRGRGDGRMHVTFVDVGQGDAAVVRGVSGRTSVIDAGGLPGGGFDTGDRLVGAVLREVGVHRLDVLVLTHGDADHIGGAATLIRDWRPVEVWEGVPVPPSAALTALRVEAARAGSHWVHVEAGDRARWDGLTLTVRHPPPPEWERQRVRNEDGIVLDVRLGTVSVVFAADVGREAEARLSETADAGQWSGPQIRLLKMPHHGSATSSTERFLRQLHPDVAVVSVGRENPFGHPAPSVLARYAACAIPVWRTDRDGAVAMATNGLVADLRSWTGRAAHLDARTRAGIAGRVGPCAESW